MAELEAPTNYDAEYFAAMESGELLKHPHRYKGWCNACDRAIVECGKRCRVCGSKNRIKGKLR